MLRRTALTACIALVFLLPAQGAEKNSTFKVMTRNMDAGTDLGYALYGLAQPDPKPYIDATLLEVRASLIPQRAAGLAAEIASAKPHLVALQEATLWRAGETPETASTVLFDQLELLMAALKEAGAQYEVVAVNTLTDIALPMDLDPGALRFTDRDVLLARSDLSPSEFHISDVHTHVYQAMIAFGPITVPRGFISALVRVNNQLFRIANTHLETAYPGVPEAAAIQELQAGELLDFMRNSAVPVVLAGDYNADAILGVNGDGPDNTETAAFIESAGYQDSWAAANPLDPGATWPLFLEDQMGAFFLKATPWERIDLIFSKGLEVVSSIQVGAGLTYPDAPSDHVGVMTTFQLGK